MITRTSPKTGSPADAGIVVGLQADIGAQLRELATSADLVTLLLDTRQDLGIAAETGVGSSSTEAKVPGSVAAYSMAAEIRFTLIHDARLITRALHGSGVNPLVRPLGSDPTTSQLIGHTRALVNAAPSPRLLRAVLVDLTDITSRASALVDGDSTWQIPVPCPHCGLTTLVGHQYPKKPEQDVVICARDRSRRGEKRYLKCVCKDPLCQCHVDPIRHRHRWYRTHGNRTDSWNALSDLINPPESRRRTRKRRRR